MRAAKYGSVVGLLTMLGTTRIADAEETTPDVDAIAEAPDLFTLKTPESPALSVLRLNTLDIQRPTTPSALATTLANGVRAGEDAAFFRDFAVEFAPFWLFPHPDLPFERAALAGWRSIYRNFTLSAATSVREPSEADEPGGSQAAVGARTTLYGGGPSPAATACVEVLRERNQKQAERAVTSMMDGMRAFEMPERGDESLAVYRAVLFAWAGRELDLQQGSQGDAAFEAAIRHRAEELHRRRPCYASQCPQPRYPANPADRQQASEFARARQHYAERHGIAIPDLVNAAALRHELEPQTDPATYEKCLTTIHQRQGFVVDMAGAAAWSFPTNEVGDEAEFDAWAVWATPGWLWNSASVIALFKATRERGAGPSAWNLDAGGRITYAHDRFGISAEVIYRRVAFDTDTETDERQYRAVGTLDYRVGEQEWLGFSFGRDYGESDSAPLIALVNLQWNFGTRRSVKPDTDWTVSAPASSPEAEDGQSQETEEEVDVEPSEPEVTVPEAPVPDVPEPEAEPEEPVDEEAPPGP